jgi:protease-4
VERSSSVESGHALQEFCIERHNTSDKIAVITVEGIITGRDLDGAGLGMVEYIKAQLKSAARDSNVKAVLLKINSPGGEVLAADEINLAIDKFQREHKKPVVVSMGSLAASGGYYISAPCRWIVANDLTMTGSIGVIMHGYNYRGLMDKVGVKPMVFKSGQFKDMLSSDQEPDLGKLSPSERETRQKEQKMVQDLIDETYGRFKEVVANGRKAANSINGSQGRKLADNWADYADGRVFSGRQALELGFVDELGNFEVAVKRTQKLAGIADATLVQYREPFSLGSLLGLLGKAETPSIKVDLGVDSPKLSAGYMYFIAPMLW